MRNHSEQLPGVSPSETRAQGADQYVRPNICPDLALRAAVLPRHAAGSRTEGDPGTC